jgi:signal transduction histidine kinase/DNA-binding response OmpR family regulator
MMKKPIRIGTQMLLGFAVLLIFVVLLGATALLQTNQIYQQVVIMYDHPLKVRRALGLLDSAILTERLGVRDLLLKENDQQEQAALQLMAQATIDAEQQFDIIRQQYLGPKEDVSEAYKAFVVWHTTREQITRQALAGEIDAARRSLLPGSPVVAYRADMLSKIQVISRFASNKEDSLYAAASDLRSSLETQFILLISALLLLAGLISFHLLRSIQKPLESINEAILRFHEGDMDSRSPYKTENEFGVLSASINAMADRVQENVVHNRKMTHLAQVMLREDEAQNFFRAMLSALAEHTGAQMAAVYLPSANQAVFELYESIGAGEEAKRTFRVDSFEGEMGAALYTQKIQHIKDIAGDTRFVFHTVNGHFIPKEIIAVPILSGRRVIAMISLATLGAFSPNAFHLIDESLVTMSMRIQGILALRRNKEFQFELERQNRELDAQHYELTAQTTELAQQNSELEMQKRQLDEASRLKTNFLSNMSHELRTPLNSVIALTGVLSRRLAGQIGQEEHDYLDVIERNGKNLLSMINDILDIARIEAGHEDTFISAFNINDLIGEVMEMMLPQAQQKDIQLLFNPLQSAPLVTSDEDKCRHILQNLVGNAVKFTETGAVTLEVHLTREQIRVSVSDTGIGIAPEHIQCIFDEFRQADGSLSRRYGGTGLGLAIAKRYALLLGGDISVKSKPNEGSEFTLCLPLKSDAGKWASDGPEIDRFSNDSKPALPPADMSGKTVLLVEDNDVAVIQIRDLLEEMGIGVMVAQDATESLTLIEQKIPDAMILDLMMPGIDGFKLLQILRDLERTASTPVLILTAKHISKEELSFLKRNNIHQLIRKGDADREALQRAILSLLAVGVKHAPDAMPEKPRAEKPVVLVTEDDPDNMLTVKALLEDRFTVLEARNAHESVRMAAEHMPDLILMDIALSGTSGIDAFHEIRTLPQLTHIPVIALTASAMTHEREAILAHGLSDAFITQSPSSATQFITGGS